MISMTNYRSYRAAGLRRPKHALDPQGYPILTKTRLEIEGDPSPDLWLLLDRDNGNPECGHGYVRIFESRQAARYYKRVQNADPSNATMLGPWRIRDCTPEFLKIQRLK